MTSITNQIGDGKARPSVGRCQDVRGEVSEGRYHTPQKRLGRLSSKFVERGKTFSHFLSAEDREQGLVRGI